MAFGGYVFDLGRVHLVLPQGNSVRVNINDANPLNPIIFSKGKNQSLLDRASYSARRGVAFAQMVLLDKPRVRGLSVAGERVIQTFPNPTNRSKARIYALRM